MKSFLSAVFACAFLLIAACNGNSPQRPESLLTPEQIQQSNLEAAKADAIAPVAGGAAGGVFHYTCPNGHPGSDGEGSCTVCGSALVHNQAWHNQAATTSTTTDANTTVPTPGAEPDRNAEGVWHYTCPNGHEGGAGSASPCLVCGTTLVHNQAYHNTSTAVQQTTETITPPTTAEPAQNANGVWHYTCPNGHEGGAGSAVPCKVCGTALVHNQAYH